MSIILQGSTSGSVTLQEPAVAGTTVLDLPAVSGTLITTGSSGQSIPRAALPIGSVLKVEQYVNTTQYSGSGTATIFSTTFTPTSATSKVLLIVSIAIGKWNPNGGFQITRNGTSVQDAGGIYNGSAGYYSSDEFLDGSYTLLPFTVIYLDSPALSSAITYGIKANGTSDYYVNRPSIGASSGYGTSTIQFLEIAA